MATAIRPEISKKNKWHLEKHRYYELKHFCMQCPTWRKELSYLTAWGDQEHVVRDDLDLVRPTEDIAEKRAFYTNRIAMVNKAAAETDLVLGSYILEGIITGKSYDALNAKHRIPACKDVYYELYRKFFYILSEIRQ